MYAFGRVQKRSLYTDKAILYRRLSCYVNPESWVRCATCVLRRPSVGIDVDRAIAIDAYPLLRVRGLQIGAGLNSAAILLQRTAAGGRSSPGEELVKSDGGMHQLRAFMWRIVVTFSIHYVLFLRRV